MKLFFKVLFLMLALNGGLHAQAIVKPLPVEPGVSLQLAQYRKSVISDLKYDLNFNIPQKRTEPVTGTATIRFNLKRTDQDLQLDFKQQPDHVSKIVIDINIVIPYVVTQEHIVINKRYLKTGANKITVTFTAGDASLNRNDEYCYALFVPDRARTVFPCFDQPDLKANFNLLLTAPRSWKVLSNGVRRSGPHGDDNQLFYFSESDKLPTYLFSFTAGKYTSIKKQIGNREAEFLYRETDSAKIRLSVDSIFLAHQHAISFMEQWTGIPFPFQKVGFVAVPDFQFGGMEHPGVVQYKASSLFLDDGATKDQFIARSNLISHETAHMWFGDLVTMAWFNDVWMKEVFANFMADKVTEKLTGSETFNQKFLQDHYPAAYSIDRTPGANPIRQELTNLQDAGSLYGNIIYHKAPIMMRQLEQLMGKENFRAGVQEYLKKYAYSNATWPDLIAILSKHTRADLYAWNKVWVNQPGRPVFEHNITYTNGKISSFTLTQHAETGAARIWPQVFDVTLVYPDSSIAIHVNMNSKAVVLKQAAGLAKPQYVLFNSDGMGYGLFPADKNIVTPLFTLRSPLQRASAYITAYENMLAGRYFKPAELLAIFQSGLTAEKDEMNLRLVIGYISNIYWTFLPPASRQVAAPALEKTLWDAIDIQSAANNKKLLFRSYQDIYLSSAAQSNLYSIWKQQLPPAGVKLTEDDYTSLALTLALKSDTATNILKQQEDRITNTDRKKRMEFLMTALSPDVGERDSFFASLADRKNRQKEAWVGTALYYLHHPLRQNTSIRYLPKSLELVEEIQKTGDIFFPQSWLAATFGSYQRPEAAQAVTTFLNAHPNYNPKLKAKILQATDNVFRARKLVK